MSEAILGVIAVLTLIASVIAAVFAYRDFKLGQRQERRDEEIPLAHPIVRWDTGRNTAVVVNVGPQDAWSPHIVVFKGFGHGAPTDSATVDEEVLKANRGNAPVVECETFRKISDETEKWRATETARTHRGDFACHVHYRTPQGNPQVCTSQFSVPMPRKNN